MIAYGKMQISDLVAFLLYVSIFIRPILRLTALAESYQKGMAGYQRFCQLMDTPSEKYRSARRSRLWYFKRLYFL